MRNIPRAVERSCGQSGFVPATIEVQGYPVLSISSEAQCAPISRPPHPVMKLPLLSDDPSRRVATDSTVVRDIYEVHETNLLDTNGHINNGRALNGEAHGHTNGDTNGHNNGGHSVARISNGDPNGNDHGHAFCNGCNTHLMIDKSVQCEFDMELNDAGDYVGGAQTESYSSPPVREPEVTVTNEWSPSGLNETVPVTAKTVQLNEALLKRIQPSADNTDDTIRAWKKELADRDAASSSTQVVQQKPPQEPKDDGPRYKINNDDGDNPDPDRHLNNTSTWRVRDCNRSSGSTSSDDEIEKIAFLEMGGDADQPDKMDGAAVRASQPSSRQPKAERPEPEEEDGECVIRCLAYTLQCCECVIS